MRTTNYAVFSITNIDVDICESYNPSLNDVLNLERLWTVSFE
ncbi:MAG: hypothetical protein ACI8ZN_001597 [Bacteroidia bacterium]|jgi:hypothetical protein